MKKQVKNINSLSEVSNENPFKVPESYFDDFEARLQIRMQQQHESKPEPANKLVRTLKPIMWLAASFLLIALLVKYPLKQFTAQYVSAENNVEEEYPISIESLEESEYYDILADDYQAESDTIETEMLASYLAYEASEYEIYSEVYN